MLHEPRRAPRARVSIGCFEDVRRMAESWDRDSAHPGARAREITASRR
jgi:hypothetical protein